MISTRKLRTLCIAAGSALAAMAGLSASAFSARTAVLDRDATERPAESPTQSAAASLPLGTILPVRLDKTLAADEVQAGQEIVGEIMQDVPLQGREKIHMKSRVSGTIMSVAPAAGGTGTQVSVRFDKIDNHGEIISMLTSLRAIASYHEVNSALAPLNSVNAGSPPGWADTVLIGGDVRYGDGGEVVNRQKQKVGKGVSGGVLVHVSAQPGSGCDGPINGDDSLQALWVFSADACGVYGLPGIGVPHDGRTPPLGVITFAFAGSEAKLEGFAGMLLRVVAPQ